MLKRLSEIAPTYLLIGNHDRPNNSTFLTNEHPFNALKDWDNMTVVDTTQERTINGQKFKFVPYVPPGRFEEALIVNSNVKEYSPNNETAIFAHQEFYGVKMGSFISKDGDKWPLNYPLIISGHIHDYEETQTNIIYTGTPLQHSFGDRSDKTVSVFKFYKNGTWKQQRIDLGLMKREIIYLNPEQIHTFNPSSDKLIKIVIKGEESEIKSLLKLEKIKELKRLGVKISYKTIIPDNGVSANQIKNAPPMRYLHRLFHEISTDPDQVRWFQHLFKDSAPRTVTLNII
jgi:DNA repair exonuclease SbcCD nuclease subunit